MRIIPLILLSFIGLAHANEQGQFKSEQGNSLFYQSHASFNQPWAMTFLPDKRLLVTEKTGRLLLVDTETLAVQSISGLPKVAYGGQGGLGDIILHPNFVDNQWVYFSYAEEDKQYKRGAAVARAKLDLTSQPPRLNDVSVIWRQFPKTSGSGHYSHRLAFDRQGHLFITSGDRQQLEPAQSWQQNLGKVIRVYDDGSIPLNNPFQDKGELAKSFWSLGHRNALGIAFDQQGRLWTHEMGPRHGDELNLTLAGENYGWPEVSWGDHYSGVSIPDHDTRPEFHAPEAYWVPTIAPSGFVIYSGSRFADWQGDGFIGGLRSQALIRVEFDGLQAREVERFDLKKRIREVEQGPDGKIWLLEDKQGGRLLSLDRR